MQQIQKRNTAYKLSIRDILQGRYTNNQNELGYLEIHDRKVQRVNLLGTAVIKDGGMPYGNAIIDDGTEKISLRSFETPQMLDNYSVGDLLLVIGKPREYNNERYILAEIVKKIEDKTWARVRELELKKLHSYNQLENNNQNNQIEEEIKEPETQADKIFKLIVELDKGEGADTDAVISKLDIVSPDKVITELIKSGSVYEVRAGRIKLV